MELVTDLREGLERVCMEAAENLRRSNDLEVKLRQACKELDDEKMAREHAEKRIAVLELAVEAAANDLKLEKLSLEGGQCRQLDTIGSLDTVGSWTMVTLATTHEEKHDFRKEVIRRTSGEGAGGHAEENFSYNEGIVSNDVDCNVHTWLDSEPETLRGMISSPENLHFKWGITDLERDVEPFGEDVLFSEEPPILVMEANLDYEGHEDLQHHSALRWKEGGMATIMAELQASESYFFAS